MRIIKIVTVINYVVVLENLTFSVWRSLKKSNPIIIRKGKSNLERKVKFLQIENRICDLSIISNNTNLYMCPHYLNKKLLFMCLHYLNKKLLFICHITNLRIAYTI